jgi:uridine kinase
MRNVVIGITGGTGSGKTFVSKQIESKLKELGKKTTLFDQDQYFYDEGNVPKDSNGQPNFDTTDSLDLNKYRKDFYKLLNGEIVEQRRYNYNKPIEDGKNTVTFLPNQIIIIEGIFSLHFDDIFEKCDLTIFVDADFDTKIKRRIKRDSEERGYDKDDVLYKFDYHVKPAYKKYIEPLKEKCQIIIKNSGDHEGLPESIDKVVKSILNLINQ